MFDALQSNLYCESKPGLTMTLSTKFWPNATRGNDDEIVREGVDCGDEVGCGDEVDCRDEVGCGDEVDCGDEVV